MCKCGVKHVYKSHCTKKKKINVYVLCLVSDAFLNFIYSQLSVCMVFVRGNWFEIRITILFQRH